MQLSVPRIVVIDDNEEDGIKIASAIWGSKYAIRFIKYDEEALMNAGKEQMRGVRVVFADINLIGDGIIGTGSKNFAAVQQVLEHCLDERNGPYVLITWSTFDEKAPELFEHLSTRMHPALRPSLCRQLNKEDYRDGSEKLTEKIKEFMNELESIGAIISWEKSIESASCETLYELIDIASVSGIGDTKEALRSVLYGLAKAEGEQNLNDANALKHLYSVLSQILYDNLSATRLEEEISLSKLVYSGKDLKPSEPWSPKLNTMLHLDLTASDPKAGHAPGDVFPYPVTGHALPIPDVDVKKFLRGNFMFPNKSEQNDKDLKAAIDKDSQLLLVEITPPCDYSQKKYVWHRYAVAAEVKQPHLQYTRVLNRQNNERENRVPDFCWETPDFQISKKAPFRIIFNSRVIVSIPPDPAFQKKMGNRHFRIRQPLLGDMIGWLTRQASRQGHVSVA